MTNDMWRITVILRRTGEILRISHYHSESAFKKGKKYLKEKYTRGWAAGSCKIVVDYSPVHWSNTEIADL